MLAANAGPYTWLIALIPNRDKVDLTKWPTNDRPGALWALRGKAATTQVAVRTFLAQDAMDAHIYQSYWIFNGFAVEAPASTLQALAARDDVAYIVEDGMVNAPNLLVSVSDNATANWNIYQVNAPQTCAIGHAG